MATGDIVQRLEVLNGLRDPETLTSSTGNICQQLDYMIEHGGGTGRDGITPTVTITTISGGHNVAFSYGEDDPRNTDVDIMDGVDGQDGTDGTDGTNGTDGITPTVTITSITGGHNVAFSYGSGDPRNTDYNVMDGTDGTNGTDGADGYTPVRGTDYWTANDISSMESYCNTYIDTQLGTILNGTY